MLKLKNTNKIFFLFTILPFFVFSKCKKDEVLPEYYINCKVDGIDYRPNNCANCMRGQLLGDTVLLLNANAGFESLSIGIVKLDRIPIVNKTYILNNSLQQNGVYDNSPEVNDIFKTDSLRMGSLIIFIIDRTNKIIEGSFSFQAFNTIQNKIINITDGQFRLKYTDY